MTHLGKKNLLGVLVDAVDYEAAVAQVVAAAEERRGYAVAALAVHGVMTGVGSREHRHRLNRLDLVTPDGQAVRWALNLVHRTGLPDRTYGPLLTTEIMKAAARRDLPIYLYGSRESVLDRMVHNIEHRFPGLRIAGAEPSRFRRTSRSEKKRIAHRIRESGARIAFVGLGCPRQEVFAYEYRDHLRMPLIAVGAAFDYHAGLLREPPAAIQRAGLQWLHRFAQEPRRLWKRYWLLNPAFVGLLTAQALGIWRPDPDNAVPPSHELRYG